MISNFSVPIIGQILTPFADKFAVPRQGLLAQNVKSTIEFFKPYNDPKAFLGLEGFNYIYVLFLFDKIEDNIKFRSMVRPPRLGGNQKVGVFATRSPFRPSKIGLSILKLNNIIHKNGQIYLEVLGADMVNKTPIIDIKPYIPFVDCKDDAKGGFASTRVEFKQVVFDDSLINHPLFKNNEIKKNLQEILACDPRPAYKEDDFDRLYMACLYDHRIYFKVTDNTVIVCKIENMEE